VATKRLSMRQTREILRQKFLLGRRHREIASSLGLSVGAVGMAVARARVAGVDWPQIETWADDVLDARLYRRAPLPAGERPVPDGAYLHTELRKPGVTLQLLHEEYLQQHPTTGYRYTQFCGIYNRWLDGHRLTMRQHHRAGEKFFVDYSGQKPHYIDPASGAIVEVELFVGVMGASNYTYAEATRTQQGPDWIASHQRAFAFLAGVPEAVVCDCLKTGVVIPCRYEPGLQRTYEDLIRHYGAVILPTRPHAPRDKAKIEVGVLIAQRWILARLRHETFFSLEALNARIAELVAELNRRMMRLYGVSRRALFERLDQPVLRPLPTTAFVYGEWKVARVNIDYHIDLRGHY
jgi:transposase